MWLNECGGFVKSNEWLELLGTNFGFFLSVQVVRASLREGGGGGARLSLPVKRKERAGVDRERR
jgi:hypothetical protein